MKICHVVTLLDSQGTFGGPASVAFRQAEALQERGHSVQVIAARGANWADGNAAVPTRTFPAARWTNSLGFGGLASPALWRHVHSVMRDVDLFHFHLGRDAVTLPAALVACCGKVPYVIQTHGMVMPDRRAAVRVTDILMTKRVLGAASQVFYLTEIEKAGLMKIAPKGKRLSRLVNGIEDAGPSSLPQLRAGVLYCSRLHPRKRVLAFAEMAGELRSRGRATSFDVAGPDEGDLGPLNAAITRLDLSGVLTYEGAIHPDHVVDRLRAAEVFVLPSRDEPFPMIVLEAMSAGTPVVVTSTCHIARELQQADAAIVCDGSVEGLANAVEMLLTDPGRADEVAGNAAALLKRSFSLQRVADELEKAYARAVGP